MTDSTPLPPEYDELLDAAVPGPLTFGPREDREAPAFGPELRGGQEVGDYRLSRRIGQGGMGQVWEAEQVSLGRPVAIKFVRPDRVTPRQVEYLEREARAGGRLSHPGLVAVHAYGESDGLAWIAMELVEGSWSLRDFLDEARERDRLPDNYDAEVARLVIEIADAMQAAHDAGVIHRDLKPQNVLVTGDGRAKVTDFGLARIADESGLSRTGEVAGTYYYMSPEQIAAKRSAIDHRTDVFSLGVVLYELLTLQRPFQGDTSTQVAEQVARKDPPDPRTLRSRIPRDLAVVCLKALEKRREDRYGSMADLGADLRRFRRHESIHARPPGIIGRAARWVRRHPTTSALTVVAALASILGAAGLREYARQIEAAEELSAENRIAQAAIARSRFENELVEVGSRYRASWDDEVVEIPFDRTVLRLSDALGWIGLDPRDPSKSGALAQAIADDDAVADATLFLFEVLEESGFLYTPQLSLFDPADVPDAVPERWRADWKSHPEVVRVAVGLERLVEMAPESWKTVLLRLAKYRFGDSPPVLDSAELRGADPRVLGLLAQIARSKGDDETAVALVDAALARTPGRLWTHYRRALLAHEEKDYGTVVQHGWAMVALGPKMSHSWQVLADGYRLTSDSERSRSAYRRSIELDSSAWRSYNRLASTLPHPERAEVLEEGIRACGPRIALYQNLVSYLRRPDPERALEHGYRGLEALGGDAKLAYNTATVCNDLERWDEAIELYRVAVELEPELWRAWVDLAHAYTAVSMGTVSGSPEELAAIAGCKEAAERAYELRPHEPVSAMNLAVSRLHEERIDEALELLALHPGDEAIHGLLGQVRAAVSPQAFPDDSARWRARIDEILASGEEPQAEDDE